MFPVAGSGWVGESIYVGASAYADPPLRMGKLVSLYVYRLLGVVSIANSYDFWVIGVGVAGGDRNRGVRVIGLPCQCGGVGA